MDTSVYALVTYGAHLESKCCQTVAQNRDLGPNSNDIIYAIMGVNRWGLSVHRLVSS